MNESCLHFTQVDVFTTRPLHGNALAVFPDGRGLTTSRMQAIAREMNLSETTFLLPPTSRGADARVRIFTVTQELPFAGHPTLGSAYVASLRHTGKAEIRLQTKAGVIPVRRRGSYFEMRQKDPVFGAAVSREQLAGALRLRLADLDRRATPQMVSTGLPFLIVPLRTAGAMQRVNPDWAELLPLLRRGGAHFPYYVVVGSDDVQARMFGPDFEDPGTGSAAGCAAAYLVRYGLRPPGRSFRILQGEAIHRPCQITVQASLEGTRVYDVRVGGHVVRMLDGCLVNAKPIDRTGLGPA
jgi:trans-2,3-dihydro-3-hydroxyanthranilate isomerase